MGVRKNSNETVQLSPRSPRPIVMKQKTNMNMFEITHWDLFDCGTNQLSVQLVMKRKILSEIMTTYFPSFLLLAITFATTFFKPFFFEAALSVNLTTMLVMTTIFISKMESLPPTSDIRMIDLWLVICQMVPFAEVVLLTAIEYQTKDEAGGDNSKTSTYLQIAPLDEGEKEFGEYEGKKWFQKYRTIFSTPDLKTLGRTPYIEIENALNIIETNTFFPEKKALPLLVLTTAIIYFAIALILRYL